MTDVHVALPVRVAFQRTTRSRRRLRAARQVGGCGQHPGLGKDGLRLQSQCYDGRAAATSSTAGKCRFHLEREELQRFGISYKSFPWRPRGWTGTKPGRDLEPTSWCGTAWAETCSQGGGLINLAVVIRGHSLHSFMKKDLKAMVLCTYTQGWKAGA